MQRDAKQQDTDAAFRKSCGPITSKTVLNRTGCILSTRSQQLISQATESRGFLYFFVLVLVPRTPLPPPLLPL